MEAQSQNGYRRLLIDWNRYWNWNLGQAKRSVKWSADSLTCLHKIKDKLYSFATAAAPRISYALAELPAVYTRGPPRVGHVAR